MEKQKRIAEKINFGCGKDYIEGFFNVDNGKNIKTDLNFDLNSKKSFPFEDSSADVIKAYDVLEHLDDPIHFMSECHRILKPQSKLYIKVPFGGTWADFHGNHRTHWTPWSFRIFAKDNEWQFQFPDMAWKIKKIEVATPFEIFGWYNWRWCYLNNFCLNTFTKLKVILIKEKIEAEQKYEN